MDFSIFITRYSEERLKKGGDLSRCLVYHKYVDCALLNSGYQKYGLLNSGHVRLCYSNVSELETYFSNRGFRPKPCPICGTIDTSPADEDKLIKLYNWMEEQSSKETDQDRQIREDKQDSINQMLIDKFFNGEEI